MQIEPNPPERCSDGCFCPRDRFAASARGHFHLYGLVMRTATAVPSALACFRCAAPSGYFFPTAIPSPTVDLSIFTPIFRVYRRYFCNDARMRAIMV